MAKVWQYRQDQELPNRALAWYERNDADVPVLIDFTTGWVFTVEIVDDLNVVVKSVSDVSVTKASTIPNVIIRWPADTFLDLPPADYRVHVMARKTSSGLDDMFDPDDPPILRVIAIPSPPTP